MRKIRLNENDIERLVKKIIKEEQLESKEILEEGVKEWVLATSIILATLGPSSVMAQQYESGDDKAKVEMVNSIKKGKEKGDRKATALFNKIKQKVNDVKADLKSGRKTDATTDVTSQDTEDYSHEAVMVRFEKMAKELGGVVGVGTSNNLDFSRVKATNDTNVQLDGSSDVRKRTTIREPNGQYTTFVVSIRGGIRTFYD